MAGALTAAIAAAFSGVTPDPYFEYTTLLLPGSGTNGAQNNTFLDGSTNNFTITRNGNTTQGTFSPFSQTGWGNYFDGSGDYINTVDNAALDVGSSAFTFEFWFFNQQNAQSGSFAGIGLIASKSDYNGSNSNGWSLYCYDGSNLTTPSSKLTFFANGTSYAATTSDGAAPFNTWTHIAVVKNGTNLTIYSNGVAVVTSSSAPSTINDTSTGFYIGSTVSGVTWNNTFPSRGYISNARLVKGVAVYTGAFTPPTSPLEATQSAGTNISAITGTQTSLLTCQSNRFIDNSTNNFTITRNGDTRVVAFSPFNPTASWSAATYGGSGYFDGSGDNVLTPSNTSFALGNDWTYEFWFYPISQSGSGGIVGFTDNIDNLDYTLSSNSLIYYNGSTTTTWSGVNPVVGAWNHIAIVKSSGTIRAYVNGNQSTNTASGPTTSSARSVYIGSNRVGTSTTICYIADFRIVKGTAVYTAAFTPPTAPPTAITNTSLLLNFTNAGIYDATSKNDLETVGNAQISNTTAKFGSTSMSFDGTGDWLTNSTINSPLYQFNSGDFTVEMWIYPTTVSVTQYIIDFRNPSNDTLPGIQWFLSSSAKFGVYVGSTSIITASTGSLSANTWTHVALVKNGTGSGNYKIYVNGTADATTGTNTTAITQGFLTVGAPTTRTTSQNFNGYIQDLRITNGLARYTANFTAPTAAFPTL